MKKLILITCIALAFLSVLSVSNTVYAQAKKKMTVNLSATTVEKSRGGNPNIKSGAPTTDKVAAKSRGAICTVNFYNHTGLFVYVYVDGDLKGSIAAYGNGTVSVLSGYTTIYCISAGGTKEWKASGDCSETYTYILGYD